MTTIDYIGFDIHKKTISFCAKAQDGHILDEGTIAAQRGDLKAGLKSGRGPGWAPWKRRYLRDGFTIT
jgi:hypothetical protein